MRRVRGFKQKKAGGIWNRKCGHREMEYGGFLLDRPHAPRPLGANWIVSGWVRETGDWDIPAKVLRARKRRDNEVYMRDMWQGGQAGRLRIRGPSCELPGYAQVAPPMANQAWATGRGVSGALSRHHCPIGCAPHCVCQDGTSACPWCAIFAPPSLHTVPILASGLCHCQLARGGGFSLCAFERFDAVAAWRPTMEKPKVH